MRKSVFQPGSLREQGPQRVAESDVPSSLVVSRGDGGRGASGSGCPGKTGVLHPRVDASVTACGRREAVRGSGPRSGAESRGGTCAGAAAQPAAAGELQAVRVLRYLLARPGAR